MTDVLVIKPCPPSPVKLTLSPLWGYLWSSLYTGIDRASRELTETISDNDWLQRLRKERLDWLASQEMIRVNPATDQWGVRILDASDHRPLKALPEPVTAK